jgi:hypothetical protein
MSHGCVNVDVDLAGCDALWSCEKHTESIYRFYPTLWEQCVPQKL